MHQANSPSPAEQLAAPALAVQGMVKAFGALRAIDDVSLAVGSGEFHALLGENGAGKSTLVKCLMGYQDADAGQILIDGRAAAIRRPADAHGLGLGMCYQHFTSVPALTAAQNLVVSRDEGPRLINWKREHAAIEAFMAQMPFRVPLDVPVGALAAGQRQKLEILKLLYLGRRFLILDEPSSVLTPQEADEVLGLLHAMARRREISVLMITHKFREVSAYCDGVTVLRHGRKVGAGRVAELDTPTLARWMVGEAVACEIRPAPRTERRSALPALELVALHADDDVGSPALGGLDLKLHAGEIVGLAGVSGNGQAELMGVISGQRHLASGRIFIHGQALDPCRRDHALGLRTLPEEPLSNACVPGMSVAENIALRCFDKPPLARRFGWLSMAALRRHGRELIERYRVATPSPQTPLHRLSGGNVQRAVLARELSGDVRVLVVANPCFGLDFLSAARVREQLVEQRDGGAAVLLISEDLDEILALSDRIAVISRGRIVHEVDAAQASRTQIGARMGDAGE